jgi:hypothetical protein
MGLGIEIGKPGTVEVIKHEMKKPLRLTPMRSIRMHK